MPRCYTLGEPRAGSVTRLYAGAFLALCLSGCMQSPAKAPGSNPEDVWEEQAGIVYLVDRSETMADLFIYARKEVQRSLSTLGERHTFQIIFFSSGQPVKIPAKGMVTVTQRNIEKAIGLTDRVAPGGKADPSEAMIQAFACHPQYIYILTHKELNMSEAALVRRLNVGGKTIVHVIGVACPDGKILREIAEQNNGYYVNLSAEDLARRAQP